MEITGIICEYNPLHNGHKKQIDIIRRQQGDDCGIVCLMSGNFVQRGAPAIFDKSLRAKAAILSGADLVLELPVTYALRSAEGFAQGGVHILSGFCNHLCFGAECGDEGLLTQTAKALVSPAFSQALRVYLDKGFSFPAARQAALEQLGCDGNLLASPNNILAVEYLKAMIALNCSMKPTVITRQGDYHDKTPNKQNPSASAIREQILQKKAWQEYVPVDYFQDAQVHTFQAGQRAVLARLRTMTEDEFSVIPFGSEGLWRKLMHAVRKESTVEGILTAVKSKRYTRTRLERMLMCAFLGITQQTLQAPAPYVRVLALNDTGREILKRARTTGNFPNIGQRQDDAYQQLEDRCVDLYGLFAVDGPEPPSGELKQRIYCHKG